MNAQPTTPQTITVFTQELSFDVPQITNFQDAWFNEYTENRRKIAAKRYWDNVAKKQVVSYDKDLLLCFYEIVFYITNGLLDAFDGVFGSVNYSVEFVGGEPVIRINTPNSFRQISDDIELTFLKVNIKTLERILGAKVVKELKATLPVKETAKKTENELCFEIGKSESKRLSAAQVKAYNNPKDTEMIYANTGHAYWTYSVNDGIGYFSPVNAKPVKINLDYFSVFEFFIVESGKNVIIYEKKTGVKVVECMMSFLDSELVKLSNHPIELSDLVQSAKKQIPFTFDINDSIESINAKRISQNEFYVFGSTQKTVEPVKVETIAETVEEPETVEETPNFDKLSGLEKSFVKKYINTELKTRNIESLVCEFKTALLTCKESDKLSYQYALNLLTTMQPQPTNNPETMQTTVEPTPQPEPLTVGQVIQGENCRLVVTKVHKKLSTKRLEKAKTANSVIKTAKRNQKNNAIAKFSIGDSVKWEGNDKYTYTAKSIKRGVAKVFNGGSNIYVNINTLTKVAEPKKEEMTNEEKAIYDIVNGTNLSGVPKCEKKGNGSYFTFSNDSCFVSVDLESKEISGKCYKDHNNEPRFYNQTSKGIKKALLALQNGFNENTSMFEAARLCAPFVRCRSYYAMD